MLGLGAATFWQNFVMKQTGTFNGTCRDVLPLVHF